MTKIDIISGFLGAGKTTFIKQLLKEAISGEKVVLIENEFGQIGIDGGFLKDAGIEIREMNSGCICCSLVGDFGRSLEEVLTKYQPDRVIIEPSGVGKLSDVMNAVKNVASEIEVMLNSAVTVVDVNKCRMYMKNFGEFFNNQIENAGTIVLSRTDVADPKKVQGAVEMLRQHNAKATIVTTPCSELTGAQLLEMIEQEDDMAEELMKESICMSIITIMIMTMTAIAAAMTTIMSITTMTMTATVAAMIMIMSTIIMTMMMTVAVTIMTMSIIITTMMTSVAVAAMTTTTITKDTIMQMMYLQAGAWRMSA